jgi:hypothetical protein
MQHFCERQLQRHPMALARRADRLARPYLGGRRHDYPSKAAFRSGIEFNRWPHAIVLRFSRTTTGEDVVRHAVVSRLEQEAVVQHVRQAERNHEIVVFACR